jgi:hypothetical protein
MRRREALLFEHCAGPGLIDADIQCGRRINVIGAARRESGVLNAVSDGTIGARYAASQL